MKKTSHKVLSANIVVLAQFHNPSILNPDFLRINHIVDEKWDVAETITTTPFSQTRFRNGIALTVDNERFNITQKINAGYPESSPIYDIAIDYIKILEHVKYTAMGLNWDIVVPMKSPDSWMVEHFLKKASIPKSGPDIDGLNLTMKFNFSGNVASFQFSPESIVIDNKPSLDVVRVRANIHYEKTGSPEIQKKLETWKDAQQFIKLQITKLIH
ncbi:MAG: hypothetical protein U9O82_07760 [Thermodesulfobacteriota bacterium]|nr:hypothetical protein [Thermodesulfobacteriota bacterium]